MLSLFLATVISFNPAGPQKATVSPDTVPACQCGPNCPAGGNCDPCLCASGHWEFHGSTPTQANYVINNRVVGGWDLAHKRYLVYDQDKRAWGKECPPPIKPPTETPEPRLARFSMVGACFGGGCSGGR